MRCNDSSVDILGIKIDNISLQETCTRILQMASSRIPHTIIPVNPEMIMMAQRHNQFREVLNQASLVLPDGVGVVIASRILRRQIKNRVTGIDTVKQLTSIARENGFKIFLLGAAAGVAERVKENLEKELPGIRIVGTYAGSPSEVEEESICKMIISTNPDILFVAFGAPKQELWVARNLKRMNVPVVMCVGGTFDFIAGLSHRAPVWLQRSGLEWLFRLVNEPWRWRRMLALPRFAFAVMRVSIFTSTKNGIR